jgi:hypothetical protein
MKKNMGATDKIIRIVAAIIFAVLYISGTVTGTFGVVLLILGGIFLLTSLMGTCPLYMPFGVNTCSIKDKK